MSEETKPRSSSLKEMMEALHAMERMHDDAPEITRDDIEAHFDAVKEIDRKVDAIDAFMRMCKMNAAMYSERSEAMETKAKHFENAYKNCQGYVLYLIERYPDVTFRGNDVQFKKKLNPPALKCEFTQTKSFSNVIPNELAMSIPEAYREARVVFQLKSSDVKKALASPTTDVNFARLEQKEKLVVEMKLKGEK